MIPARYEKANYDTDVPDKVKSLVRGIAETKKGIYIHGSVGSGKTHMAYAIKKRWDKLIPQGSHFWNTTELIQEIKDDFDRDAYSKKHTLDRLMRSENLLILDDIGVEKVTDWVQERFYLLINRRYNEMRPIIFTSNYSIGELELRIGDRITSRIVELCDMVEVDGTDRRFQKTT